MYMHKKLFLITLLAVTVCVLAGFSGFMHVMAADTTKPAINLFMNGNDEPPYYIVYGSGGDNELTADASDDTGITKVEFYVDDILYATDTTTPYGITWDVAADTMSEGKHTVSALAYDAAGNLGFDDFAQSFDTAYFLNYTCSGSVALICEDFQTDDGEANFTTAGGEWVMGGSIYYLLSADSVTSGNGNLSIHNTAVPNDFTLRAQAEANGTGPDLDFSIIWGYQDANNYYYASFSEVNSTESNGIFRISSGTITELADFSTTIQENVPYKVKVEKTGSNYRIYRNGISMASVNDAAFSNGKVGFGSRDDDQSFYFTTLESGTPPAYTAPPVDTISPTAILTAPVDNATVSGSVPVKWGHVDNIAGSGNAPAISSRQVLLDGTPLTLTSSNSVNWDSKTIANGTHTVTLNATDAAGNTGTNSITINVDNDTTPPVAAISAPSNNSRLSGNIVISANATDNVGVTKVEFYRGATKLGEDTSSPYSYSWNTGATNDGPYLLTAKAYDSANNITTSAGINITVNNNRVIVHRLYNPVTYIHLWTTTQADIDAATQHGGYRYEGIAFFTPPDSAQGIVLVHRLYNPRTYLHLWSTTQEDIDAATQQAGYYYEGIAYHSASSSATGAVPVHRLYNPKTYIHFWTTSQVDIDVATQQAGYYYEGIAYYAFTIP